MKAASLSRAVVPAATSRRVELAIPSVGLRVSSKSLSRCPLSRRVSTTALESTRPRASAAVVVCVADVATMKEVEFKWNGFAMEVLVTGDFMNWDQKLTLLKTSDNVFTGKLKLPPGRYSYKFIVDGIWRHSDDSPTVADGAGGFNNTVSIEEKKAPVKAAAGGESAPAPTPAAPPKPAAAAAAAPAGKQAAPAGKAGGKKAAGKAIGPAMEEDIIPVLKESLGKEKDIENLAIVFDNNELRGSFVKYGIPYDFWAFFPDGDLNGARGFSLTSCGNPPSTVEPFIIDERKITPELVVFWVTKRLFAQKLLSLN